MKNWIKHIILFILLSIFAGMLVNAQEYLKKDTVVTFYVNKSNNVGALYEWSVSPALPSFNPGFDTIQKITWNGDTTLTYMLIITPKDTVYGFCDGNPDTMLVKLYSDTRHLPVQVSWENTTDSICSPLAGSAKISASVYVQNNSGPFILSYQVDTNREVTLPPALTSPVTFNIDSGLTAAGINSTTGTDHYVRITRIETNTANNQPITQNYTNDLVFNVHLKPFPAIGEIISENVVSHIQTLCANGVPEKYTINGEPGMVYHWNTDLGNSVFKDSSGKTETDTLKKNILVTWPAQNHYLYVFGEAGGCYTFTKSLTVIVNNLPLVSLGGDVNLCQGQDTTFRLVGNFKSIQWANKTSLPTYTTNKNDTVIVVVTDSKDCPGTDTAIVRVFPLPKVYLGKDTMLCGASTLTLDAGNGGINYLWKINGADTSLTTQTISVNKQNGGKKVSVLVTVVEQPYNIECSNSDTIWIIKCNEIFAKDSIYTVFTPNGDGKNDSWKIPGLSDRPSDHPKAVVQVYDRWGRLVFQSQPGYPMDWDGRDASGKYLPMDNYYYIISLNEKNTAPVYGSITIIR